MKICKLEVCNFYDKYIHCTILVTMSNKEQLKLLHNEGFKVTYEGGLLTWQLLIGLYFAHRL